MDEIIINFPKIKLINMNNLKKTDIDSVFKTYLYKSNPEDRFTSYDYCYNYFKSNNDLSKDMEKSCYVLGFYLASWGMYRGSSFLLDKSVKHFENTINYLSDLDKTIWDIDVDNYSNDNIKKIIELYNDIKAKLIYEDNSDLTLVTKILLGVFGFVPAFDVNFKSSFKIIFEKECGFSAFNIKALESIKIFYEANKESIDKLSSNTFTTDFTTSKKTKIIYKKAKIIDVYGFITGKEINIKNQKIKNKK